MREFLKNNGLSLALFGLFAVSLVGQFLAGWHEFNNEQIAHGEAAAGMTGYLGEGHFWAAMFENWESEFLQMAIYVLFTIFLYQKGSSESKTPDAVERVDVMTGPEYWTEETPWPVKSGGFTLKLYENSLSLVLLSLFAFSFYFHAAGGAADYNQEQMAHGGLHVTTFEYMETSRFWFESFQNWQSEFLSIGVMVLFTVYLRQKGSPESKPVDSPNSETGCD
ncbi:MAG: DUF6766 family protein [Pyrinomonadaceae bacterium]